MRVFQAAADAGVGSVIYQSSVGAYSPGYKDRLVDESWPTDGWPEAAYCREKAYIERVLDNFERRYPWVRVVRLRPGFLFKEESAAQQRRLFAGPFLPARLVRTERVPVVPDIAGVRVQALHSDDAAHAVRLAVTGTVRGPFNLAAEPIVDAGVIAELLGARTMRVPLPVARAAVAGAYHARIIPASPQLFDAMLRMPLLDTTRAHEDLQWFPTWTGAEALAEFLKGLRRGSGMKTPPLASRLPGGGRLRELATGMGRKA
jgi:nucleoside-diphosphate-sugar epimerase